jgi:hypothetical protein
MAEINDFASKKAIQQVIDWEKAMRKIAESYASIAKNANTLIKAQNNEKKSTEQLTASQKESLRLQKQLETTKAKNAQLTSKTSKELIKQQVVLQKNTKALKDQAKAAQGIKKTNGLFKSMTKSIIAAGVAMIGIRTVFNVFKNSLKTIANFEQAMSKVRAVTGALPKDFKALQTNAKLLGSTTSKTATQVASLQLEFAKLGFSTTDILNATEATISLSIAAGSDLAESAKVAASTINGFGLSASETQRVVDVMAKSFSSSALDLQKFQVGMANAQVAAKVTGRTLEETAAFLSILSDTGIDASKAGTDLRVIFSKLAIKGVDLNKAMDDISKSSNKVATAQKLVGDRAFSSLITLTENRKVADELTESYNNAAGAAEEMARIMEDNLLGDVDKLTSAWEGFILGLNKGEGTISNVFRGLVKWLTAVVSMFNMANKSYKELVEQAKSDTLRDFIKGDADEVAFLTEKLGDYDRALNLVIESLKVHRANWMTDEEREVVDARILALEALKRKQDDVNNSNELNSEESSNNKLKRDKISIESDLNYLKNRKIISAFILKEANERLGSEIESEEDFTTRIKEQLDERLRANNEYLSKIKTDEADYYTERNAIIENSKDLIINSINSVLDFQLQAIDNQLDSLDASYQTRINAQSNLGESTVQLETEFALKRQAIEDERAKKEKQQALLNIGVSTAQAAFDITANALTLTSAAVLNPLLLPLVPLAWSQLGLLGIASGVQLAAVSQFDKGTGSTPSDYIAGEKGAEFRQHNGQWSLLTEPTLFTGSAGDSIISTKETESILSGASMKATTGNAKIDTAAIVNAIHGIPPAPFINSKGYNTIRDRRGNQTTWINKRIRN